MTSCGWDVYHGFTTTWTLRVEFVAPLTVRYVLTLETAAVIYVERCTKTYFYCGPTNTGPWTPNIYACGEASTPSDPDDVVGCTPDEGGCAGDPNVSVPLDDAVWTRTWEGEFTLTDCADDLLQSVELVSTDGPARSFFAALPSLCSGPVIESTAYEPCAFSTVTIRLFE